jgi:hypothetical protein
LFHARQETNYNGHIPANRGAVVKGLAKQGNYLHHDLPVKYVDVSLFQSKSGYSPMTQQIWPDRATQSSDNQGCVFE